MFFIFIDLIIMKASGQGSPIWIPHHHYQIALSWKFKKSLEVDNCIIIVSLVSPSLCYMRALLQLLTL